MTDLTREQIEELLDSPLKDTKLAYSDEGYGVIYIAPTENEDSAVCVPVRDKNMGWHKANPEVYMALVDRFNAAPDLARALLAARAELAQARADTEAAAPVAWKYRWKIDGEYVGWRYSDASNVHLSLDGYEEVPLYDAPPAGVAKLVADAEARGMERAAGILDVRADVALVDMGASAGTVDALGAAAATIRAEAAATRQGDTP